MRRGDHALSSLIRRIRSPPELTSPRPTPSPFNPSTSERKTDPQKLSCFRQSRRVQSCSLEKARQAARQSPAGQRTDCLSRSGAAVKNLSHSASFHSKEKIAPSNPGTKQLEAQAALALERPPGTGHHDRPHGVAWHGDTDWLLDASP